MPKLFLLLLLAAANAPAKVPVASEHFVDAGDGVRIAYNETGKGSPLIVVHGGPGMDHLTMKADLAPLERRHRVIYYDQRGGGRSTLPDDPALLTIDHHVDDLEALRRTLGLDKVTLVAHSFGPAIAALYAIRYPQHVERMVLISPIPPRKGKFFEEFGANLASRVSPEELKKAGELQRSLATAEDAKKVCHEYWAIMTKPRLAKSVPVSVVKSDMCGGPPEALRNGGKTNRATFGSLGDWNWTADLGRVQAPTLIIHGEEDAIPMTMVEEWATALPHARILRLPHTAHFPYAERPETVFPAIETFLRGAWPKQASTH
jgi:proline iminopeptidase